VGISVLQVDRCQGGISETRHRKRVVRLFAVTVDGDMISTWVIEWRFLILERIQHNCHAVSGRWQWVSLAEHEGYNKLILALLKRGRSLGVVTLGAEQGFVLTEFSSLEEFSLVNSAGTDGHVLRITPSARFTNGAAWSRTRQYVQYGFDTIFEFKLTKQDQFYGGGDGLAFVIQDSGDRAIGGFGASLGFGTDTGFNIRGIPGRIGRETGRHHFSRACQT
jgi:Bacterial lectin